MKRSKLTGPLPIIAFFCLLFLSLGCQTLTDLVRPEEGPPTLTPVLRDRPVSTFVPPRRLVLTGVDETVRLETYHINNRPIDTLEITINGQTDFPADVATVQIVGSDGQPLTTASYAPDRPTANWTVELLWTGRVPGVYEVSVTVTDVDDRQSEPASQRVEVR